MIIAEIRTGLYYTAKLVISSLSTQDTHKKINEISGHTEKCLYHLARSLRLEEEEPDHRRLMRFQETEI